MMCVSIPGRVTALQGDRVELDVLGARRVARTGPVPEVKVGDYVLTGAGVVVAILNEDEALTSLALFREFIELEQQPGEAP